MRVVVSGAAGFIGSHLCQALLEDSENEVIGVDNFEPFYARQLKEENLRVLRSYDRFVFKEESVTNPESFGRLGEIDIVYHYAANAGVRHSLENPLRFFYTNVFGTATMLEAFRGVRKFVFASSSSVYGDVALEHLPVGEARTPAPKVPYALSKVQAEELCAHYDQVFGLPTTMLRFHTVYGSRQRPDELFTIVISRLLKNQEIQIYGDGNQSRDFTHVSDIVRGSLLAGNRGRGIYNLGSGGRVTVNEVVAMAAQQVGVTPRVRHVEPYQVEARHTYGDITKARRELDYEPQASLELGLGECIPWCRKMVTRRLL